jgi:hypothetical protein
MRDSPKIHFHLPPLGRKEIVENVMYNKGGWRTLEAVHRESIEERRAKKLSDLYEFTEIPSAEFDEREFGI